ncbi:heme/hemin ABC transporter substrate-binding protein [Pontibacter qinzhouensis]|nr:ABC transporter substrate-binding protein [Pontibacter qinzhouensis]
MSCTKGTSEQATAENTVVFQEPAGTSSVKIVTVGGTITETVCALGLCDNIVATDLTSSYPEHMRQLPSLGYRNSIKAEGIISTGAELVLVEAGYLDKVVEEQLAAANIKTYLFENKWSKAGSAELITALGKLLQQEGKATELVQELEQDFAEVNTLLQRAKTKPKVLFVYARGQGTLNIGGRKTFADAMLQLAGAQLAVPEIEDYKPLTAEAMIAANPDYLLFFDTGLQSLGGAGGVAAIPGIKETAAGKKNQVISMDGLYLSGFGPRLGKAVKELAWQLHPELHTPDNLHQNALTHN